MRILWTTFAALLLFVGYTQAQTPIGASFGHSSSRYFLASANQYLPEISWYGNGHDSEPCAYLDWSFQFDHKLVRSTPSVAILFDGTTDLEMQTPVAQWMLCTSDYVSKVIQQWPLVQVVFPTVPPHNAICSNGDDRPLTAAYNAALEDPITGLAAQFPNQVTVVDGYTAFVDQTQCISGTNECYANSNFITCIDIYPGLAQEFADWTMRTVIDKVAGVTP